MTAIRAAWIALIALAVTGCERGSDVDTGPVRTLYVTSRFESAVAQFRIHADGSLTPLTPLKTATGGEFSDSLGLAVSPDGRHVYVADGPSNSSSGPASHPGTITQFWVDGDGSLVPRSPLTADADFNPIQTILTPDGRFLYVCNEGSTAVGQYRVDPDGTLSPLSPATVFTSRPSDMAVSPDGRSLYVTNEEAAGTISQFTINANGTLAPKSPFTVACGVLSLGIVVSPNGQNVYVTNRGGANVSQFSVNPDGTLSPLAPATVAAGNGSNDLAISPDGAYVYALNNVDDTVSQYSVGAGGALTPLVPATVSAGGSQPREIVITSDGRNAYVANKALSGSAPTGNIACFVVGADGSLVPMNPAFVLAGDHPRGIAIGYRKAGNR